jgi:molybdenum cofactor sulfurtransferase
LRTGCFCNPGAGEIAHHLSARQMTKWFERNEPMSFLDLRDRLLAEHGLLVAAVRISVGLVTNFADVYRFLRFMQQFLNRRVDEIGRARFTAESDWLTNAAA